MAIPTQTEMNGVVLQHMADGAVRSRKAIRDEVKASLNLSANELAETTSSGKPTVESRIDWAVSNLKAMGMLTCVSRGAYRIEAAGSELLRNAKGSQDVVDELRVRLSRQNAAKTKGKSKGEHKKQVGTAQPQTCPQATDAAPAPDSSLDKSPQEVIDAAISDINDALADELLDAILRNDPSFFEQLVVDVLTSMGYGTGKVTQLAHDGGIDGVIDMDALGLDQIYVQAKRYEPGNSVGRPTLQSFAGAMDKVSRGVFITTSTFTKDAIEYAKSYSNATIVLIDGRQLAHLMIRYGVGVNVERTYEVKRFDSDYFE